MILLKPKAVAGKGRMLDYQCGKCKTLVGYYSSLFHKITDKHNYCRECGTKVDWSDLDAIHDKRSTDSKG